jgi:hypothetical protein
MSKWHTDWIKSDQKIVFVSFEMVMMTNEKIFNRLHCNRE